MSVDFHLSQYTKIVSDLRQEVSGTCYTSRDNVLFPVGCRLGCVSVEYDYNAKGIATQQRLDSDFVAPLKSIVDDKFVEDIIVVWLSLNRGYGRRLS